MKVQRLNPANSSEKEQHKSKRVAIYARVSTDASDQENSFEAQKYYFIKQVLENDELDLVGVYTDNGVSGLLHNNRTGFNQMVADALDHKIDIILTKSLSRFARNTLDTLTIIRKLQAANVNVHFEKEQLDTLTPGSELMLTFMGMFAQEESRSISENVKWGKRKMMADGKYSVAYSHFLGYDKGFKVNEEEAVTVRKIYELYLQGYSTGRIANYLESQGYLNPTGGTKWSPNAVGNILTNEKYKGDALNQKYFVPSYLSKHTVKNRGQLDKYYISEGHEPIIEPTLFNYVQYVIAEKKYANANGASRWSARILCGVCGGYYSSFLVHSGQASKRRVLRCGNRYNNCATAKMKNSEISDADLNKAILNLQKTIFRKNQYIGEYVNHVFEQCGINLDATSMTVNMFKIVDLDDSSILIKKIVVLPDGRLAFRLFDRSIHIGYSKIWYKNYEKKRKAAEREKAIRKFNLSEDHPEAVDEVGNRVVKCLNCGAIIRTTSNALFQKKYCSKKCRVYYYRKNLNASNCKEEEKHRCPYCDKEFYGPAKRKYCSMDCYVQERNRMRKARYDENGKKTMVGRHCLNCRKFFITKEKGNPKLFCCYKCKSQYWFQYRKQSGANKRQTFKCAFCGKEFQSKDYFTKYCSRDCYNKGRAKEKAAKDGQNQEKGFMEDGRQPIDIIKL